MICLLFLHFWLLSVFVSCFVLMWRKSNRLNNIHMSCPKTRRPVYENNLFVFIASVVIVPSMFNHTRSCRLLSLIVFIFIQSRTWLNDLTFHILDSKRVYPQIRVCVPSSHPDHTPRTNWTKFANFKRGSSRIFLHWIRFEKKQFSFEILVSSLAMSSVAEQQMFIQLFDSVVVRTPWHYHLNDRSKLSKYLFLSSFPPRKTSFLLSQACCTWRNVSISKWSRYQRSWWCDL